MCASVVQPTCESRQVKYVCAAVPPVDAKPIGEPGGDQRAAQAVLEWKGHPQVGREAEHSDDLGGTDALGLSGPSSRTPENLPKPRSCRAGQSQGTLSIATQRDAGV